MDIREKIDSFCMAKGNNPLPDCGLLLVGSNPLPVYAVINALRPQHVLLVGTEEVSDYLQKIIAMLPDTVGKDFRICNPFKSQDIRAKVKDLMNTVNNREMWFSYTAGTKSMSVNGFEAWRKVIDQDSMHWGIYVSPYGPQIFLNDLDKGFLLAPHDEYNSPVISFKTVVDLHLNTLKDDFCRNDNENQKLVDLAKNIHSYIFRPSTKPKESVLNYLKLIPPAYLTKANVHLDGYERSFLVKGEMSLLNDKNYRNTSPFMNFDMQKWAEDIVSFVNHQSLSTLDDVVTYYFNEDFPQKTADHKIRPRISAMKWLTGQWLEVWVADALKCSELFSEVHDSCILYPNGVPHETDFQYEVDVCAIRGITPFIFTCTIDTSARGLNKSKLFEVGQRSRQLGGEHARSALVCLSDDSKGIKQLINEGWTGYNTVQVFGIDVIYAQDAFIQNVSEWVQSLE